MLKEWVVLLFLLYFLLYPHKAVLCKNLPKIVLTEIFYVYSIQCLIRNDRKSLCSVLILNHKMNYFIIVFYIICHKIIQNLSMVKPKWNISLSLCF